MIQQRCQNDAHAIIMLCTVSIECLRCGTSKCTIYLALHPTRYASGDQASAIMLKSVTRKSVLVFGAYTTSILHINYSLIHYGKSNWKVLRSSPKPSSSKMPSSLLTLPYELREQILADVLYHKGSIKLQYPVEHPDVFTPPITQVCKLLREEAIRVFYHINTFLWTIDPEAVSLKIGSLVRMYLFCLTSAIIARIHGSIKLSFVRIPAE